MERARELREIAARCLRLSKCINSFRDIEILEAFAAEAIRDAERIEVTEATARVAERYSAHGLAEVAQGPADSWAMSFDPDVAHERTLEINLDSEQGPAAPADRRRPGRREDTNPTLIPLLRGESDDRVSSTLIDEESDQLRAPRGIIIWGIVSAALWAALLLWCL